MAKLCCLLAAVFAVAMSSDDPTLAQEPASDPACDCLSEAARDLRPGEIVGLRLHDGSELKGPLRGIDALSGRIGLFLSADDLATTAPRTIDCEQIAYLERWEKPHHSKLGAAIGLGLIGGALGAHIGVAVEDDEG